MCGFAGVVTSFPDASHPLEDAIVRMRDRLAHRGPDDVGAWIDQPNGVGLGFRRLAILDVSPAGHQPMVSASGRYVLAFNGEVYNYRELRQRLSAARLVNFRGGSDTEVVLAAIEEWGVTGAVKQFTGMFAMAVWDRELNELTLLRDRLGIKPLYFYARNGTVLFGSELKALLAHPHFDRELDQGALTSYFRYLYVPAPHTIFRHAKKLNAGCLLRFHRPFGDSPKEEVYWSVEQAAIQGRANPVEASDGEMIDELDRNLKQAVALRMRSDVPLGALLSGGVDSSTVVALMQEASSRPIQTFCIGFDEGQYDESRHAKAVAHHLGTSHTSLHVTGRDALDTVPCIVDIFDEPFADPSQIPSQLVCKLARRDVTVALSGDGGDEVFAGYNRYTYGRRALRWANAVPVSTRRMVSASVRNVSADELGRGYSAISSFLPHRYRFRLAGEKLTKFRTLLSQDSQAEMYRSLLSAWQQPAVIVNNGYDDSDSVDFAFAAEGPYDLMHRMQMADQIGYMPDDLLAKVDRVSMSVSLEVRVPLIDHNVVEYSWRLPLRAKVRRGQGKWILREVLARRVPRNLTERPKMGFSVPLAQWLLGPLRPWAEDLLSTDRIDKAGVLNADWVQRQWSAFNQGHTENAASLWTVLMFEAWRDRWLCSSAGAWSHGAS